MKSNYLDVRITHSKSLFLLNTAIFFCSSFSGQEGSTSGEDSEEEIDPKRLEVKSNEKNNVRLLLMARYLIPAVGAHVRVLILGCCPGLTNGLVSYHPPPQNGKIVRSFRDQVHIVAFALHISMASWLEHLTRIQKFAGSFSIWGSEILQKE